MRGPLPFEMGPLQHDTIDIGEDIPVRFPQQRIVKQVKTARAGSPADARQCLSGIVASKHLRDTRKAGPPSFYLAALCRAG